MHLKHCVLSEISSQEVMELMNHPLVKRHLPLAPKHFGFKDYKNLIAAKEAMWRHQKMGPFAWVLETQFIGWGGLQEVEDKDVEIALVLHPKYWGMGKKVYDKILKEAFEQRGLESIIALFPLTRCRLKGLKLLGFQEDGKVSIEHIPFLRYRLFKEKAFLSSKRKLL